MSHKQRDDGHSDHLQMNGGNGASVAGTNPEAAAAVADTLSSHLQKIPAAVALALSPIIGLLFVIFMPLAGIVMLPALGVKAVATKLKPSGPGAPKAEPTAGS